MREETKGIGNACDGTVRASAAADHRQDADATGVGDACDGTVRASAAADHRQDADATMEDATFDLSVIIPCYNQGRFLAEAIESLLGQKALEDGERAPRVEIIVVNDGSTDETREVAGRYAGRIVYVEQKNAGLCAARNRGVLEATTPFLQFMDADDWLAADFHALMLRAAARSPEMGLFHSSCQLADEDRTLGWLRKAEPLDGEELLHVWLARCQIASHSAFMRKSAFARTAGFNREVVTSQDWDMWIRMAASGVTFQAVPEAIAMYRRYDGSVSRNYEKMMLYGSRMLYTHGHYHGRCAKCRRAVRTGLRNHWDYCYQTAYWQTFGRLKREEGKVSALRFLVRTVWQRPRLGVEILRHANKRWLPWSKREGGEKVAAAAVPRPGEVRA